MVVLGRVNVPLSEEDNLTYSRRIMGEESLPSFQNPSSSAIRRQKGLLSTESLEDDWKRKEKGIGSVAVVGYLREKKGSLSSSLWQVFKVMGAHCCLVQCIYTLW